MTIVTNTVLRAKGLFANDNRLKSWSVGSSGMVGGEKVQNGSEHSVPLLEVSAFHPLCQPRERPAGRSYVTAAPSSTPPRPTRHAALRPGPQWATHELHSSHHPRGCLSLCGHQMMTIGAAARRKTRSQTNPRPTSTQTTCAQCHHGHIPVTQEHEVK